MANPWIVNERQLSIAEVVSRLVTSTATASTYRRMAGVVDEVCDVCGLPTDSEGCREHCKK